MEAETRVFLKYTLDRAVRICPFCDTENPVELCNCFLCGTDLLIRRDGTEKKKRWWERDWSASR